MVVTHLSSLSGDRVCAAGWSPREGRFVRLKSGPDAWDFLSRDQLVHSRRRIRPGDVIAFDHRPLTPVGPQCENVWILGDTLRLERSLDTDEYRSVLERAAVASLEEGMGGKPEQNAPGRSCRMAGASRSLCIRRLEALPTFEIDERDERKVRTRWVSDGLNIRSLVDCVGAPFGALGESPARAVRELSAEVSTAECVYFACSLALPVEDDSYWLVVAGVESFAGAGSA